MDVIISSNPAPTELKDICSPKVKFLKFFSLFPMKVKKELILLFRAANC